MGYDMTSLVPSDQAFYGIITGGGSTPVGWATLPVAFSTSNNYRTEYVNFEVAEFETSYNAILGRPSLAKFMAIPNHTNLVLVAQAAKNLLADQQPIPAKESTSELQLAPAVATKTIILQDDEPHKTAVIGTSLDPA
ncbi:uncharacterized protein LOC120678286 [Panicum virgatum]|uniref:uncharacterized protein LOC120678286 n=1 Tax=Panicum virgatum TaxID=38727 RepID=UPI0019D4F913|nr:uncharacterized protein LOC120678286 [Panicum virgatum]